MAKDHSAPCHCNAMSTLALFHGLLLTEYCPESCIKEASQALRSPEVNIKTTRPTFRHMLWPTPTLDASDDEVRN